MDRVLGLAEEGCFEEQHWPEQDTRRCVSFHGLQQNQRGDESHLKARKVRYSSPTSESLMAFLRSLPLATSRNVPSENSSSVMSLVSLSLPASPRGETIEAWRTNVRRMCRTRSSVLEMRPKEASENQLRSHDASESQGSNAPVLLELSDVVRRQDLDPDERHAFHQGRHVWARPAHDRVVQLAVVDLVQAADDSAELLLDRCEKRVAVLRVDRFESLWEFKERVVSDLSRFEEITAGGRCTLIGPRMMDMMRSLYSVSALLIRE